MLFLYRRKKDSDRDACAYIGFNPMRFECNHYFGAPILGGPCYSGGGFRPYEDIETILTEEEYDRLLQFSKQIRDLGFGIEKGSERYRRGCELCDGIQDVYDHLKSDEAIAFYEKIKKEEDEILMDDYGLTEDDLKAIFEKYELDYHDRSVVSYVFDDVAKFGREEALELGYMGQDTVSQKYFDYERFGKDLITDDNCYLLLPDGRVVCLSY